ncbi:hypothetical protein CEXT_329351 [Caerostris extrusa]|uniref:Uncharacterized protein n=1 Tax=Caerostris extrusa TaxID=172846 RepID=A0AAV4XZH6_CAEEX|nr:hypothetical protein CEXT_329351 [Caerostris extrusa]
MNEAKKVKLLISPPSFGGIQCFQKTCPLRPSCGFKKAMELCRLRRSPKIKLKVTLSNFKHSKGSIVQELPGSLQPFPYLA